MARPNNDFQFLDVERTDPPKRDLDRRKSEYVEIYDPFNQTTAETRLIVVCLVVTPIVSGNAQFTTIFLTGCS